MVGEEGGRRARGGRRNKEKDGGRKTSERGRGEEGVWVGERDRRKDRTRKERGGRKDEREGILRYK